MCNENSEILIIEDSPENLEYVSAILTKAGYHLEIAINGLYAMTRMVSKEYDLVIVDLSKPGMNGKDLLSMIKTSPLNDDLPVIFIIPPGEKREFVRGMDIGSFDFVCIPINEKELLTRINYQLELKNAKHQLEKSESYKSSLNYAYQIQASLLPSNQLFDELFSSHFLLSLPLDIVSGDFYWVKRIEDFVLVTVADATGHGVPGAFLSVLGISLLNEISPESRLGKPSDILNDLRCKVKNSLMNNQLKAVQDNGLDMAICMIDTTSYEMSFSGAYNSVLISRNDEIIELKGDRQPIGSYINERPFQDQRIQLHSGDKIYFSSDGYADQIGGGKNAKKYQRRNFKKLLSEIAKLPLTEQKNILLEKHIEWKGNYDQVDDILILGLELPVLQTDLTQVL
ncbi:MAG: response regulator [Bacteroidales bacterium]|nr:response regulator [Bacteroidales bacterium]